MHVARGRHGHQSSVVPFARDRQPGVVDARREVGHRVFGSKHRGGGGDVVVGVAARAGVIGARVLRQEVHRQWPLYLWRASLSLSWMTRAWTVWMVWCRLSDERDL